MNAQLKEVQKASRNRSILRSYDYANGTGTIKDANTQETILSFRLSDFPEGTVLNLALSKAMDMIAGAGVEAHRDGEDAAEAIVGVHGELQQGKVEFRDGVGVAMGGTLKRVARALVDLGKTYVRSPDGAKLEWASGDLAGAFSAMQALWSVQEDKARTGEGTSTESGRTRLNKIKAIPEVAAKLASYAKGKAAVELG